MLKVQIIGNLTRDPESRALPNGSTVCSFTVAENREWKDKDGNKQSVATYTRCSAWNGLGEICQKFLTKGREVYVEGEKLWASPYLDNAGKPAASLELEIFKMEFVGSGNGNGNSNSTPAEHTDVNAPATGAGTKVPF